MLELTDGAWPPSSQQELGWVHTEVLSQTRASVAGGLWGTQATRPHGREQLAQAQAAAQAAEWLRAPAALTAALVRVAASGTLWGWWMSAFLGEMPDQFSSSRRHVLGQVAGPSREPQPCPGEGSSPLLPFMEPPLGLPFPALGNKPPLWAAFCPVLQVWCSPGSSPSHQWREFRQR